MNLEPAKLPQFHFIMEKFQGPAEIPGIIPSIEARPCLIWQRLLIAGKSGL